MATKRFSEVVGQSHVLTALENALAQNRLHHAYLFSGTRGVGKTTIGRLFAKGLNCEEGITATPCGKCSTCREIDEGRFVDLLEIDAASRTKVEDTRELLDNVQYKPARGRFKVYLIDEVHMLSRHSFNALLKTLEEPPEYVKFILATTDPQKLPVTILSRCLQFHLKPISVDEIRTHLEFILEQEQVSFDHKGLSLLAHAANGSMRDAQSLADQAIALGNGVIQGDLVARMLGTLDTDYALHLLEAMAHKQVEPVMTALESLAQNGVEWDALLQQLATQLHRLAMYQALPSSLDRTQPDAEKVELMSQHFTPQELQLYYQIVIKGREDIAISPSERIAIEMVLLRMMAFKPQSIGAEPVVVPVPQEVKQSAPVVSPPAVEQSRPAQASAAIAAQPDVIPTQSVVKSEEAPMPQEMPMDPEPDYAPPPMDVYTQPHMAEPPVYNEPEQVPQQPVERPVAAPTAPTGLRGGLRHQLKSKRDNQQSKEAPSGKKFEATSGKISESVLDRVAQKHGGKRVSPVTASQSAETQEVDNEPYQWKPSKPVVSQEKPELTPTQIKKALEHEKTPEMAKKLLDESVAKDSWAATIQSLQTPKLVEQLALNSCFEQDGDRIRLTLRATQGHLNTDKARAELARALSESLGINCQLTVEIGDKGETPLELRDKLYQQRLQQAFSSLAEDKTVQFIEKRFSAQLDNDSVRPV